MTRVGSRSLRTRGVRYGAVVALLVAGLASTASAHQDPPVRRLLRLSLVSSAQPTHAVPVVTDQAYRARLARAHDVDANTVATASAGCDGCQAVARTVQILDAGPARHVRADNVATAWSSCRGCGSHVVSVQIVLTRRAADLTVNNRALGVNDACARCDTTAAAYQVVMSTRGWVDIEALRQEVVDWVEAATPAAHSGWAAPRLAPRAGGSAAAALAPRSGSGAADRLGELEQLAADQTGGRVLSGAVQVR